MEFIVFGLPGAALTAIIVQFIKSQINLDGKAAIAAAVIVGVALALLNHVAQIVPGFAAWYEVAGAGLLAGLAACGMYDTAHTPKDPTLLE